MNNQQYRWRRERDSNPRYPFEYSGFQDRLFQPLTHPSAVGEADFNHTIWVLRTVVFATETQRREGTEERSRNRKQRPVPRQRSNGAPDRRRTAFSKDSLCLSVSVVNPPSIRPQRLDGIGRRRAAGGQQAGRGCGNCQQRDRHRQHSGIPAAHLEEAGCH